MSMKSYKARGIVLHTLKYGDSGMVVYLLTDSGGRQSYMVQGVRSARGHGSKLALFQPMFAVEFEGLESSRMQMHRFREVRSGIVLQSLPFDVRKSTIALFMAEVLYRLVKECEPNQRLFDFVWGSVAALDALDEGVANFHLFALNGLPRVLTDAAAEHDVHAVLLERAGDRRMTQILGRDDLARDRIEIRNVVNDKLLGTAEMLQQNAVLIRHCDLHNSNSFAFLILRIAYHNFHHSTTGSFLSSLCKKLQSGPCVRRAFSLQ